MHSDGMQRAVPRAGHRARASTRDRCRRAHRRREGLRRRDPPVRARRRPPALGVGHRRPRHATAHARLGASREGRLMTVSVRRAPGRRHRRVRRSSPLSGNPASASSARLAAGTRDRSTSATASSSSVAGRGPSDLARLAHLAGAGPLAPGRGTELLVLDPHGHVEHAASVLDDGETTWLIADAGRRRRPARLADAHDASAPQVGSTRDADLTRARFVGGGPRPTAADRAARPAPAGVPLVWIDPWPHVGGRRTPVRREPAPRCRPRLAPRRSYDATLRPAALAAIRRDADVEARRPARRRSAAHRGVAPALGARGRRADAAARARLAALGRAPEQGLLSRAGDRREGAQPRPSAASPRGPAPRRQRRRAARAGCAHVRWPARRSAASPRPRATTNTARSRSPSSNATLPIDATLTVAVAEETVLAAQEVIVPPECGSRGEPSRAFRGSRRAPARDRRRRSFRFGRSEARSASAHHDRDSRGVA